VPPTPPPAHQVPSTDGVSIALHDLGGDGPPLLLCHPTGFLGMTWAPLAAELAGVAHSWALDFRGHGDSTAPASGDFAWTGMADDVLAVVDHLGVAGVRACGHSMGGGALLMAEHRRPGTFAGLWLFEPIAFPALEGSTSRPAPLAEAARKRRPAFPDRDAAYANFASKPPLASLTPAALRAYVDHGLRDTPDGDAVELKCAPDVEAAVFQAALRAPTFTLLPEIRCPVTLATGGDAVGPAQIAPMIADRLPNVTLERHPEVTHFGPMEDPAGMAASVRAALDLG
jgi:pimeloyl-ACP methyl ester carboxylesterase